MSKSLFSPSWYRVAHLRPRLRGHAKVHRQTFRGRLWYVLQDQATGQYHRFSPSAHLVISLMDGTRSVQEIWDLACAQLDDDAPGQDEVIRLLAQLHRADVLHGDVPPDIGEMTERAARQRKKKLVGSMLNPMAVRVPLFDPERFVSATYPLVRPLFGWFGVVLFAALVGSAVALAGLHWPDLTENIGDRVLAAESLLLLLVAYPCVKAVHELGHAYAVKHWGGEVHEMGVMFLVFMPVPYVDATAAAGFREKWRRALVGAAGIIVELLLASLALFVWLNAEPGIVRGFAFSVMLIGGVSTLLFNGNPLLRFDGYYVFSDLIEIPNLYQRANRYLGYLVQRYLFDVTEAVSPANAPGEARWFLLYGVAAFVYRLFIVVAIILFVASEFLVVGMALAIWTGAIMYGLPLLKGLLFLMKSPSLRRRRARALGVTAALAAAIGAFLFAVPVPYGTIGEGIVWVSGDAVVHARTEGIVAEVMARPNSVVEPEEPLVRMEDPFLGAKVRVLEAQVEELRLRFEATKIQDLAEAQIIAERLRHAEAELAFHRQRSADLVVRSPVAGRFILARPKDLPGRFLRQGETLGYVADLAEPVVRVVVGQDVIDLVRQKTRDIEVRLTDHKSVVLPALVAREIPSATDRLPSLALSSLGGGDILLDPSDASGNRALERIFQLELRLPPSDLITGIGGRVHVRFDHGSEPLGWRMYRSLRQVFLRRFNV